MIEGQNWLQDLTTDSEKYPLINQIIEAFNKTAPHGLMRLAYEDYLGLLSRNEIKQFIKMLSLNVSGEDYLPIPNLINSILYDFNVQYKDQKHIFFVAICTMADHLKNSDRFRYYKIIFTDDKYRETLCNYCVDKGFVKKVDKL